MARAKRLLGPWEKAPQNPILHPNEDWQCPGHGSIVSTPDGRDFLLYHSYRRRPDTFTVGREALLDEIRWGTDGWPVINSGKGPTSIAPAPLSGGKTESNAGFVDDFNQSKMGEGWQWPMFFQQEAHIDDGDLAFHRCQEGA